jgi:hypothetical protein
MSGEVLDDCFCLLVKRARGPEELLGLLGCEPLDLLDLLEKDGLFDSLAEGL